VLHVTLIVRVLDMRPHPAPHHRPCDTRLFTSSHRHDSHFTLDKGANGRVHDGNRNVPRWLKVLLLRLLVLMLLLMIMVVTIPTQVEGHTLGSVSGTTGS
jgi:hypothetical protein